MGNAALAINLILGLLDRASAIGALLQTAQKEGRDITSVELDALFAADDVARTRLQTQLDRALAAPPK